MVIISTTIIANPPFGIYRGDIHIGQAFYHVLLDVYYRFLSKYTYTDVIFPAYSFNVYGKRGDRLVGEGVADDELRKTLDANAEAYISTNRLRDRLNLGSDAVLTDKDELSIDGAQTAFMQLLKLGLVIQKGESWFLDIPSIASKYDLMKKCASLTTYPNRISGELERMIEENTIKPLKITRSTRYAVPNPMGGENLGPLFVLSTMWEGNYQDSNFIIAASEDVLAKYVLLRFLIRAALSGNPGMDGLFVYNKIQPEDGLRAWNIKDLTKDVYETDMVRYALISSHSLSKQIVTLGKNLLKGGRNFVYFVGSMRKAFYGIKSDVQIERDEGYVRKMKSFKFNEVLSELEIKLRALSRKINQSKEKKEWGQQKPQLLAEYLKLIQQLSPMLPAITSLVKNDLKIPID